jgi:hypothetical protein
MVGTVLGIACRRGDAKLHDRLVAELKKTKVKRERNRITDALTKFLDPALARKTQELALTDDVEAREAVDLMLDPVTRRETRDQAWAFFRESYDRFIARIPPEWGARYILSVGESFCSDAHRDEYKDFFGAKAETFPGGPRRFNQHVERINLCIAEKKLREPAVRAYLEKRK